MKLFDVYTKRVVRSRINPLLARINMALCKPVSIHFSITHKCPLSCKHCDIWKTENVKRELNTQEVKEVVDKLKTWLGPFSLNIAGGEPFVRKDMIGLIEYCTLNGIEVNVSTNGVLIDKALAKKILNSGLKTINISLDSTSPSFHDYLRNKKGTFKKVANAIKYLNTEDRKLCIVIATVLMKQNCEEVQDLIKLVKEKGLNGLMLQPLFQNFGNEYYPYWYRNNQFWPDNSNIINKTLDKLIENKRSPQGSPVINSIKQLRLMKYYFKNPNQKTNLKCKVGINNFCINEYGDSLLCFWLPQVGNLLEKNPQDLWVSQESRTMRVQILNCERNCKLLNCHFD